MATIYLIRHGQASFGAANYDQLSVLGEEQARATGTNLSARLLKLDHIVSGDLNRQQQSMQHSLSTLSSIDVDSLTHEIDPNWNEFLYRDVLVKHRPEFADTDNLVHFIKETAHDPALFKAMFSLAMTRWLAAEQDDYTESALDFAERVQKALNSLVSKMKSDDVAVVYTSGGVLSVIAHKLMQLPIQQAFELNWTLANCGVTKLNVNAQGSRILSLNEHSHFEGAQRHLLTFK